MGSRASVIQIGSRNLRGIADRWYTWRWCSWYLCLISWQLISIPAITHKEGIIFLGLERIAVHVKVSIQPRSSFPFLF